jgi:hypothetical protein
MSEQLGGFLWVLITVGMVGVLGAVLAYGIARSKRRTGAEQAVAPELRSDKNRDTR